MKRNLKVLAFVAVLYGAQAAAAGTPVGFDESYAIPVKETYADRHAGEAAKSLGTLPVGSDDYASIPVMETYADRHKNDVVNQPSVSAFPRGTDSSD